MLGWLRTKGLATPHIAQAPLLSLALPAQEVTWRADVNLPIPDWHQQPWPESDDGGAFDQHASGLAAAWLDAMAVALAQGYARAESDNFMLLSTMAARPAKVLLDYLERSRRRVLATLPRVAQDQGHGKTVVMVFADEESYYHYTANYGSDSSEPEAFSGGMFIDAGYGHFVFTQGAFESMEPVVVHELTHCLVRHLDIPAWLNEGLAVNTEQRFCPSRPRYRANELQYLMDQFWNETTIQEFWNGKSFRRPDDGQPLSYELARLLVQLLDKDYDLLARYCNTALRQDAGQRAALEVMGANLKDLAAIVLGDGPWEPQPALWSSGTERGQFRP